MLVHSYLGNQTRKARRALEIVSIFDLSINTSVPKELIRENKFLSTFNFRKNKIPDNGFLEIKGGAGKAITLYDMGMFY